MAGSKMQQHVQRRPHQILRLPNRRPHNAVQSQDASPWDPHCDQTSTASSLDLEQLDVEDQSAVGRNPSHALAAVRLAGGNDQTTLTTDGHALDTNVPTLDHLTLAELEAEGGAFLVGCAPSSAAACTRCVL